MHCVPGISVLDVSKTPVISFAKFYRKKGLGLLKRVRLPIKMRLRFIDSSNMFDKC